MSKLLRHLSCVQLDIYRRNRKKYGMPALSAYQQALMWKPAPEVEWVEKSTYTHPERGMVKEGPITYRIRLITDEEGPDFILRGKLTSVSEARRCDHYNEPVKVGRGITICPDCARSDRPARGRGALVVWTDMHNGGREAAWFEPEDTDPYDVTRAYFIKAKYGKAQADELARRYLSESAKNAQKVLEGRVAGLGVQATAFVDGIELAEETVWGVEYEDESSMEYILETVREQIHHARYAAEKGLADTIQAAEKGLVKLYGAAGRLGVPFKARMCICPDSELIERQGQPYFLDKEQPREEV